MDNTPTKLDDEENPLNKTSSFGKFNEFSAEMTFEVPKHVRQETLPVTQISKFENSKVEGNVKKFPTQKNFTATFKN